MRTLLERGQRWLMRSGGRARPRAEAAPKQGEGLRAAIERQTREIERQTEAITSQSALIERQTSLIERQATMIERQASAIVFQFLPDKTLRFNYQGQSVALYIPDGDFDHVQASIFRNRTFFEEPLLRFVRREIKVQGAHVVDVGANIGNHTVYFAGVCGAASCASFEPNPYAASILERNVQINGLDNVEVHRVAVSDRGGSLSFGQYRPRNLGGTSFDEDEAGAVPARRLDDCGLARVDFLKIDVEGMAGKVLAGARDTLAAHRPPVLIEMFKSELEACVETFKALGYGQRASLGADNYIYESGQTT